MDGSDEVVCAVFGGSDEVVCAIIGAEPASIDKVSRSAVATREKLIISINLQLLERPLRVIPGDCLSRPRLVERGENSYRKLSRVCWKLFSLFSDAQLMMPAASGKVARENGKHPHETGTIEFR